MDDAELWERATDEVRRERIEAGRFGSVDDEATVAEVDPDGGVDFWDAVELRVRELRAQGSPDAAA